MSVGMLVLTVVSVLILFGVAQRVLDKMRLSDTAALIIAAAIFFGGLIPNIPIGSVRVNVGGALVPVGVCVWLLIKAETGKEKARALIGSVLTGAIVFACGLFMPNEPESIMIDPNYLYGLIGGVVAYVLGRSRRAAFICGVLGVLLADTATAFLNWSRGVDQALVLGGAGAVDAVVISGILAVLLAELIGEIIERMARPKNRENKDSVYSPVREGGDQ